MLLSIVEERRHYKTTKITLAELLRNNVEMVFVTSQGPQRA